MADKSKKPEDVNQIEKHLNSKLFQKFLQKEGDKLTEANLVPRAEPLSKPVKRAEPETRQVALKQRQAPDPDYWPESRSKDDWRRFEEVSEPPVKTRSKFMEEEEVYVQPQRFNPEPPETFFRQSSIRSPQIDERPSRSRWQDDPYQGGREDDGFPRDSELKGFSDYIPPGESFVYFEPVPENPAPKPKPNLSNYYPDPLVSLTSSNQQLQDLEDRLRSKEIEISQYKQDIDHLKSDLQDLEEKLDSKSDLERRLKNLRVEKEMHERKSRGLEEENNELKRQLDMLREDVENARFKADDVERASKLKIQDLERELRSSRERISDLERELTREKGKSRKTYQDDYQDYDRNYYEDDKKNKWDYPEEPRRGKRDDFYYEEPRKGNKRQDYYEEDTRKTKRQDYYDEEPRKNKQNDWYQDPYQDKKNRKEEPYSDRGFNEKNDEFRPDKIKEQVKARIGATNSSSVSSALNWGEKPRKNGEILNLENQILALQTDKKRFEEELAKIPEHGKKIALIRRREEIENELVGIHSKMANLKIRVKQLQSKDN
jgi:predicted  nucleic acid-binding Zn-ribbon protein